MVFLVGISIAGASSHETKLAETTLGQRFTREVPGLMIEDKVYDTDPLDGETKKNRSMAVVSGWKTKNQAYDSDPLDEKLKNRYDVQLMAPHKENRSKLDTQDGR